MPSLFRGPPEEASLLVAEGSNNGPALRDSLYEYLSYSVLYWELAIDFSMVVSPVALMPLLILQDPQETDENPNNPSPHHAFIEFSLIYLLLIQSWLLYSHHFKTRFDEISKIHYMLQCLLIVSFLASVGVMMTSTLSQDDGEELIIRRFQNFSLAMIILRTVLFLMFARVAVHVWRAAPVCLVVCFSISNSILCLALATISDRASIRILWSTSVIMDFFMELIISLCIHRQRYIPAAMQQTIDRFGVIVAAPCASVIIASLWLPIDVGNDSFAGQLFRILSVCILLFFVVLYYLLRDAVARRLGRWHAFVQTLALIQLKGLGLALWTVGAYLLILLPIMVENTTLVPNSTISPSKNNESYRYTQMLGLAILVALVMLFGWKACGGQPYQVSEIVWILAINGALCVGTIVSPKSGQPLAASQRSTLVSVGANVGILAILILVEALGRSSISERIQNAVSSQIASSVLDERGTERQYLLPLNEESSPDE